MSPCRLLSLLAALLLVMGLSALPAAAAVDRPAPGAGVAYDDCFPSEDEMTDEDLGLEDELSYYEEDEAGFERRIVDDPDAFGGEETGFGEDGELSPVGEDVDPTDDDGLTAGTLADEELADEELADELPCFEELEQGVRFVDIDDSNLNFDQLLAQGQTFNLPSGGKIKQTLSTAKGRLLGTGHRTLTGPGTSNVRIKLNAKGRKHRRTVRRVVRLTLDTTVELASGEEVTHSQVLRVKPSKLAKKPKKKPAAKPSKKPAAKYSHS